MLSPPPPFIPAVGYWVKDADGNAREAKWNKQGKNYSITWKITVDKVRSQFTHAIIPEERGAPFLLPGIYTCNKGQEWTVGDSLAE